MYFSISSHRCIAGLGAATGQWANQKRGRRVRKAGCWIWVSGALFSALLWHHNVTGSPRLRAFVCGLRLWYLNLELIYKSEFISVNIWFCWDQTQVFSPLRWHTLFLTCSVECKMMLWVNASAWLWVHNDNTVMKRVLQWHSVRDRQSFIQTVLNAAILKFSLFWRDNSGQWFMCWKGGKINSLCLTVQCRGGKKEKAITIQSF